MTKRHDENKDLRSVSRVCKIDYGSKTLICKDKSAVGIHTWGKIDYLTRHCGWYFVYDKSATISNRVGDNPTTSVREAKKIAKEHKLSDKTKKKK